MWSPKIKSILHWWYTYGSTINDTPSLTIQGERVFGEIVALKKIENELREIGNESLADSVLEDIQEGEELLGKISNRLKELRG